jgi:hypothetical protein
MEKHSLQAEPIIWINPESIQKEESIDKLKG